MNSIEKAITVMGGAAITIAWIQIFRKAGYQIHHAILMGVGIMVPFVNIVIIAQLALKEWPIQRAIRVLRDPHLATEQDALDLYSQATRLEAAGKIKQALSKYEEAMSLCPSSATARDAQISWERLKTQTLA